MGSFIHDTMPGVIHPCHHAMGSFIHAIMPWGHSFMLLCHGIIHSWYYAMGSFIHAIMPWGHSFMLLCHGVIHSCYAMGSFIHAIMPWGRSSMLSCHGVIHAIMPWVMDSWPRGTRLEGTSCVYSFELLWWKWTSHIIWDSSRGLLNPNFLCDHDVVLNSLLKSLWYQFGWFLDCFNC
jgi:hypothetical protein